MVYDCHQEVSKFQSHAVVDSACIANMSRITTTFVVVGNYVVLHNCAWINITDTDDNLEIETCSSPSVVSSVMVQATTTGNNIVNVKRLGRAFNKSCWD